MKRQMQFSGKIRIKMSSAKIFTQSIKRELCKQSSGGVIANFLNVLTLKLDFITLGRIEITPPVHLLPSLNFVAISFYSF